VQVKTENLRWFVGFVIPEGHAVQPHANLSIHTLPASRVVHATFPWNKYNIFAPMIGPKYALYLRVFPLFCFRSFEYLFNFRDGFFCLLVHLFRMFVELIC
jgi:hypothetical protein